jgi:spermidine/putrescine-binding protein
MDDSSDTTRSRRAFLATTAVAATGAVAGCTGSTGGGPSTVSVLATADYDDDGVRTAVEESVDANVDLTTVENPADIGTGEEAEHDVLVAPHQVAAEVVADGGAQAIATEDLPNYDALYETYRGFAESQLGDDGTYGVPTRFDWTGYAYDGGLLPSHDAAWDNVFGGIPGTYPEDDVALLDDPVQVIAAAAFNLGYGDAFAGDSFSLSDEQLSEVQEALERHKRKYLYDYIAGGETFASGMTDNEFLVSQAARSSFVALRESGNDDAVLQTPPEGTLTTYDTALVAEGASDTGAAVAVVDAFLSAEAGAELAAASGRLSANRNVDEHLSADEAALVGSVESETLAGMVPVKPVENGDAWVETLQAVKDA